MEQLEFFSEPPKQNAAADLAFAVCAVLSIVGALILYQWFPEVVGMLLVSALLSYALLPLVDRVSRKLPRSLAVLVVALGGAGLVVLVVTAMAPAVAKELNQLPDTVQKAKAELATLWSNLQRFIPGRVPKTLDGALIAARDAFSRGAPTAEALTGWAAKAASGITAIASGLVFVPVFVFLMLRGYYRFTGGLFQLVPPRWRERFRYRVTEADCALSGFVRGQLLIAAIQAVLYGVGFSIIGIPLGLVVGIVAGFSELVPFLGNAIALVLGSLLAIAGGQPSDVLWVVAVFGVNQVLEATVLSPWIVGGRAQVRPVAVIVALAVAGQLVGLLGLLTAVPAAALLKIATRAAAEAYRASSFFRRRAPA